MAKTLEIFAILLWKDFLIRKKHWKQSILVQVVISIVLFIFAEMIRLVPENGIEIIDTDTHYDLIHERNLVREFPESVRLRFSPKTIVTEEIIKSVRKCLKLDKSNITACPDEKTMLAEFANDAVLKTDYHSEPIGIIFETNFNENPPPIIFKYKLRTWSIFTNKLYDPMENGFEVNNARGGPLVPVQICLDKAWIKFNTKNMTRYNAKFSIQQMPYPPYDSVKEWKIFLDKAFAGLTAVMFVIVTMTEIAFPANEKIIGIDVSNCEFIYEINFNCKKIFAQILMVVNGVKTWMNLMSWLVTGVIWSIVYLLPIVLLLRFSWHSDETPFLACGNSLVLFLALLMLGINNFCFGYHLSSYFRTRKFIFIFFIQVNKL